jgi:hypothetical protein
LRITAREFFDAVRDLMIVGEDFSVSSKKNESVSDRHDVVEV